MLQNVTLKSVSRADVDRIAWWLEDEELSSRWFGHYGCGDPVHRGYDPKHMLEASDWEWQSVFGDPHRHIFSIYTGEKEHVGECQVLLDGEGGAELSLLIGRKDMWHRGYGTSTVLLLLDRVFTTLGLERGWVNVPEDNAPALGLFENLGFTREATRELCRRPDGTALTVCILAIEGRVYQARQPGKDHGQGPVPSLTITGLPGSGSAAIGAEIARLLGCRFVDEEMLDLLCERLRCSPGEIAGFEASHGSLWSRLLSAIVVPMEWSATYDAGYHLFRPDLDHEILQNVLTKEQYLKGLASVTKQLCAEGHVVLHGHGGHMFVPSSAGAISVFVWASTEPREQLAALELGMTIEESRKWLKRADGEMLTVSRHLHGSDLRDMGQFDITLNTDRLSAKKASEIIVGALQSGALREKTARGLHAAQATGAR